MSDLYETNQALQKSKKSLMITRLIAFIASIGIIIIIGILVTKGYNPILTGDDILGIWTLIVAEESDQYQIIFNSDGTWLKENTQEKYWEMGTYTYDEGKLIMTRLASIEDTVQAIFNYTIITMSNTQITMKNDQTQVIQTLRKSQS